MKVGRVTKGEPGTVWVITLPAHQAIKLKRVFPKLGAGPRDEYVLSDTPENARDLQWFLERYEMTTDAAARAYLEQRADEHREQQSLVAKMLLGKIPKLPVELALPAREYQTGAAALAMASKGLLLADDVGLGKTATSICCFCDDRSLPALVVAPTALPQQWRREIAKFAPALRVAVIQGTQPYDLTKGCRRHDFTEAERLRPSRCRKCGCRPKEVGRGPFPMPDVIVTSYSKIVGWAETFAEMAQEGLLSLVVWDECLTADTPIQRWPLSSPSTALVDLRPGDAVASFDDVGTLVADRVVGITFKGRRQVWRLTLEDGRHLDCTENERLLTDHGWVYAREVIDEAVARDEGESTGAAIGDDVAAGAGLHARGRAPGRAPNGAALALPPRADAGGLHVAQGGGPRGLRTDAAAHCAQSWLRQGVVRLRDGDQPRLRILAIPLPPRRTEDGDAGVARSADVGGHGLLVHGRRPHEPGGGASDRRRHKHALVQRDGGAPDDDVAGDARIVIGGRRDDHGCGAHVLDSALRGRGGERVGGQDPPVRSVVHGLQGATDRGGDARSLRRLRRDDAEGASPGRDASELRSGPVPLETEQRLAPRAVVRVESLGVRAVWDVETERHHTFIANGFAVHNCQELRREWGRDKEGNKQRTQKYAAAKLIADNAEYRLGLSATPIYNWGSEFFTVMECIRPGALGTLDEFLTEWCDGTHGDQAEIKDPKAFGVYVRGEGMMLRRTRKEVGRELPPLSNVLHKVECDSKVLEAVEDRCAELARFLLGKDKVAPTGTEVTEMGPVSAEQKARGASMKAATELDWRLRQATGLAKAPYVAEFVRLLVEGGEDKILLVGWHHEVYDLWMKLLGERDGMENLMPVMHTGRESAKQKEEARAAFITGQSKVLIMSLRSGAGVDGLQGCCRTIVYGELDPSPGVHQQMSGRPHRDGQTDPVFAYYLVSEDGSDPHLMDLLGLKTGQAEGIRDPERELTEKLTGGGHHVKKLAEAYLAQREKRARARIDAAAQ